MIVTNYRIMRRPDGGVGIDAGYSASTAAMSSGSSDRDCWLQVEIEGYIVALRDRRVTQAERVPELVSGDIFDIEAVGAAARSGEELKSSIPEHHVGFEHPVPENHV